VCVCVWWCSSGWRWVGGEKRWAAGGAAGATRETGGKKRTVALLTIEKCGAVLYHPQTVFVAFCGR
jgi:hypothetical protein